MSREVNLILFQKHDACLTPQRLEAKYNVKFQKKKFFLIFNGYQLLQKYLFCRSHFWSFLEKTHEKIQLKYLLTNFLWPKLSSHIINLYLGIYILSPKRFVSKRRNLFLYITHDCFTTTIYVQNLSFFVTQNFNFP